jgi:hypothetical protein
MSLRPNSLNSATGLTVRRSESEKTSRIEAPHRVFSTCVSLFGLERWIKSPRGATRT